MKKILSFLLLLLAFNNGLLSAQSLVKVVPDANLAKSANVMEESYQMTWYALRDTSKFPMANIQTLIKKNPQSGLLVIVQTIQMKNMTSAWVDSTIVRLEDFSPVYHSSYNMQREMVLNFSPKECTGYYKNKMENNKLYEVKIPVTEKYFDSNFYPFLLKWMPLKTDTMYEIPIFDYNPAAKQGLIRAYIEKSELLSNSKGQQYLKVQVRDEITEGAKTTHFLDAKTKEIIRISIQAGKMQMLILNDKYADFVE